MPDKSKAETLSTPMTGVTRSAETAPASDSQNQARHAPPVSRRGQDPHRDRRRAGRNLCRELCRREGIHPTIYYKWPEDFMEAGKAACRGDTLREATSDEVKALRPENERLKQLVADLGRS
jgi:hypothetical protein